MKRRNFLKNSAISILPALSPLVPSSTKAKTSQLPFSPIINFFGDGETFEPVEYINELQKIYSSQKIIRDRYGSGGTIEQLEKKFADLTGKE
ncbi:MAG: hypothetical protein ACRC2O_00305, partial [Chitinophagaceae bacterium]